MKRSSMFLLELMAMVLIFSLCATVCMRMIGSSWTMSERSEQLTEAVYLAEAAAAHIQSGGSPDMSGLPGGAARAEEGYLLSSEQIASENGFSVAKISVTFDGELIYALDVTYEEGIS